MTASLQPAPCAGTPRRTLPLFAAQPGIWLAEQIDPEANAYTVAQYVDMQGDLNAPALLDAIRQGLDEADVIHARFALDDEGQPIQRLHAPERSPAPDLHDVRTAGDPAGAAMLLMREDLASAPMAGASVPLHRHMLIRIGDARWFWYQRYHHLVVDGYGLALLTRRIAAHYDARLREIPVALPPLVSLSALAEEYAAYAQSEACARDRDFWHGRPLGDGAPPSLARSEAQGGQSVANLHVHRHALHLDATAVARLTALGTHNRLGAPEMVIAAIACYLHGMTGASELALGLPMMRRIGSLAVDSVAPTVNVLPLHLAIASQSTLLDVSQTLADALRAMRRHQRYDAERLQRERGLVGSGRGLYGPTVNLKVYDPGVALLGVESRSHVLAAGPVEDMEFGIWPQDDALVVELAANPARYAQGEVVAHGRRLRQWIDRLIARPAMPVGTFPLPTDEEQARIASWSRGPHIACPPAWSTVLDVFRDAAAPQGAEPALSDCEAVLSFAQLETQVAELARLLIAQGIGAGDIVATALPRRSRAIVAMLAVLNAGAAWMPLDLDYPAARLAAMCEDARPVLILTDSALADRVAGHAPLLRLDDPQTRAMLARQRPAPVSDADRRRPLGGGDAAYILYTSGSTGRPKGVMVPHAGLLNLLLSHAAEAHAALERRLGQRRVRAGHALSFSFDSSWEQILWLLRGHELHLCDEEQRRDAEALVAFLRERAIDAIDLSPSMLQQMVDCGLLDGGPVPSLILVGGEAIQPALWNRLRATPDLLAYNYYGPTEYSVDTLGACLADADTPIIGRPVANTHIAVLDALLRPVPVGSTGELYVGGPGLAIGYLGRPDLTASRFIASPFAQGERLYRTGDLVRWRDDGQVEYLGRSDHQMKIRGFRVEAGEVEQAIATLPGVTGALVMAKPWGASHRLFAWCTGQGNSTTWLAELARRLPDYMIPASLVRIDAWPLTVNGKIDRAALPDADIVTGPASYANPLERALCDAIAGILGLDPGTVRPDADFFMLGGDSIGAMALGTAMRRQGYGLRPRDIFAHRRADRMAAAIAPIAAQTAPEAESGGDLPPLPMVRWFARHHGLAARFAHGVLVRVPAGMDARHLEQGLAALVRAHPALGARALGEGLAIPLAHAAVTVRAGTRSLDFGPPDFDAAFADAAARLDPHAGRMMEAMFWTGDAEPGWLMLVLHHLVTDGVSWRVILPELEAACTMAMAGAAPLIAPEECSLRRWGEALNGQRATRRAELPLWRETLAAPVEPLFPALGAGHIQATAQHLRSMLDAETSAALLDRLPAACNAGVEELLLAALLCAMARSFGARPVRISMESHGRDMPDDRTDPSRTIGWLTAEYPVLLQSTSDMRDALRNTRQALRQIPDRGIGFGILRYLDPEGEALLALLEAGGRPEILFNYLGRFAARAGLWTPQSPGGRFTDAFAVDLDPAMRLLHTLEVNAFVDEAGAHPRLAIQWSWADSLLDRAEIERLHAAIGEALAELAALVQSDPAAAADTLVPAECPGLDAGDLALLRDRHGPLRAVLPLLPLQQGLLFHAQIGAAASRYNSVTRLYLDGTLDQSRLQAALDAMLCHHPQLAAHFDMGAATGPWQVLPRAAPAWPLARHDLSGQDGHAAALDAIERDELARDFAIEGGLLVHAALARLDAGRHCLLLNAHHLVVDGWSTPILVRDLLRAYGAGAASLSAPAIPYAEVVRHLAARDEAPARAAWAEALAGARPTLLFDGAEAGAEVRETELALSAELEQALRARCREQGLTLNTLMQGMWGAVLSILTGRADIVFGTPVSGRTSPVDGVEDHIGLFSNTVPVRVQLDPARPLLAQLAELQARQGALMEQDGLGLAAIQRLAGGETLFDTLLVSENYPADDRLFAQDHGGLRVGAVTNRGHTHYPLTIMVLPGTAASERLRILIEHRDRVADPAALAKRMQKVLEHMAHAGDIPWSHFDPRLPDEIALIDHANATRVDLPARTLRDLLDAQGRQTPDIPALFDEQHRLTYAEMRAQVRDLARRLHDQGIGRGDIVAVALPRSARLALALHAVIEAGAAYLPLDTDYPEDRLTMMLEDARPALLITESALSGRFAGARKLLFDGLAASPDIGATPPPVSLMPDDPTYLIYTSGSTGRPKGALLTHRALVNRLLWMQHHYPIGHADRVLQKTPCSFDVSVWEFFWPLLAGATLVMAPPAAHRDPEAMARLIAAESVTVLHFVPSMLSAFLGWLEESTEDRTILCASLRQVFASGEALPTALARRHGRLLPQAPLDNLYGPTEAAIDVSWRAASAGSSEPSIPIGRPVWNTRMHILDSALRPVPVGVAGELYLAGDQLARCYRDRPALTASRFVADPFSAGERMYRTGDMACWSQDGEIRYLGRNDDQLKIRGQRIELGEIEAALRDQPGVAEAAAQACAWGAANKGEGDTDADARQILGYVVPAGDEPLDGARLRAALAQHLPVHMVPAAILPLASLPVTPNGKLDRKALPLPATGEAIGRPPRPGMESQIAGAFARLLELPFVQAEDDFFALGGHSLLAMRLAADLRRRLARSISVGQIMAAPSVERLAALLSDDAAARDPAQAGFGPILHLRGGRGAPLFCFHPASGFAWQYAGLSRHVPRHIPLVGLQSPRDGGVIATSADLAQACRAHLATLRMIQPRGPYHLLGYSLGGTLAQGVAALLREQGERVAFLGLLDTYPPEGQDWGGPVDAEAQAEADREREQFLAAATQGDAQETEEKEAMFAGIVANYADAVRLLAAGRTPRFDGTATLFVATRTLPPGWDIAGCWAPFLGKLAIHHVDCAHADILAPATLETLGPALADLLSEVPSLG